jgi:preprotein translocase subunit SecF
MKYVSAVLLLVSFTAIAATTLYKTVDEQGNVTYSDAPPAGAKEVQEIDIKDGDMNVLPSEDVQEQIKQQQRVDKQAEDSRRADNQDWQQRYEKAQAELDAAEKALESAQEIQEGDTVGSAFGGARPNAEWIERLQRAESDVEHRRGELDKVKRQRR